MKNKNFLLILVVAIIFFGLAFTVGFFVSKSLVGQRNIQSFADCAAAGYPIMESYPRQCRTPAGRNFVEQIPEPEIITGIKSLQYDNSNFGFSFWYPQSAEIRKENLEGYLSLTNFGLVGVFLPQDLFTGTNLGEAAVIVGVSTSTDIISKCERIDSINGEQDLGQAVIGSTPSHKFFAIGAAAGNTYESTIYRLVYNRSCYEIVELLHSGNIYNYPAGAVQEFNKAKLLGILEKMAQSFKFSN